MIFASTDHACKVFRVFQIAIEKKPFKKFTAFAETFMSAVTVIKCYNNHYFNSLKCKTITGRKHNRKQRMHIVTGIDRNSREGQWRWKTFNWRTSLAIIHNNVKGGATAANPWFLAERRTSTKASRSKIGGRFNIRDIENKVKRDTLELSI